MRVWTLVTMTIIAGLSGCANIGEFTTVDAPAWEAGYTFAYDLGGEMTVAGFAEYQGERQEIPKETIEIPDSHYLTYEVLGTMFESDGEPIYVAGADFIGDFGDGIDAGIEGLPPGIAGMAVRHRDLLAGPLGSFQACDPCDVPADAPSGIYIDFPLTPGKEWSYEETADGVIAKTSSQAVDLVSLDLDGNSVEAIKIVTSVTYKLDPEVREAAKEEGADVDIKGGGTITTYYSPIVQNVIRERYQLDVTVKAAYEGAKSEATVDMDLTSDLIGAILDPSGERTKAEIEQFLASGQPIRDPTGALEVPMGDYTISLETATTHINGADGEAVTFDVNASTEIPADHTIKYEVVNAAGQTVAEGEGAPFDVTFEGTGVHAVRVTTWAGDALQAKAVRAVTVDYQGTMPVTCGPVVVTFAGQTCGAISIPVAPGATEIAFSVAADRPVPGNLRITDGYGTTVTFNTQNGQATSGDLSGLVADGSAWTIQWRPTVTAADGGDYGIDLQYGGAGSEHASSAFDALPFGHLLKDVLADQPLFDLL